MKSFPHIFPLLGAGLLLALTACGSSPASDTSAPDATTPSTASAQASSTVSTQPLPAASSSKVEEQPAESTAPAESTQASDGPEPKAIPSPTVIEVSQAPAQTTAPVPVPTGTVVTIAPGSEPTQQVPSAAAAQAPSSAAGIAICDYGQMYVAAATAEGGAAGSKYITLTFTNTGSTQCAINGYPSVHYVDAAGRQIGAAAAQATEWSSSGATLQPGSSISATLRETHAQLYGETCQGAPASGYSIQAPGASQPLVLSFPAEACTNTAISQLSVGAVGANP